MKSSPIALLMTLGVVLSLSWPVRAQSKCVSDEINVTLDNGSSVTLGGQKTICRTRWNIDITDNTTWGILTQWAASEIYKICREKLIPFLWSLLETSWKSQKEIVGTLHEKFAQMSDICIEAGKSSWLNFPLPEWVAVVPFLPEAISNGVIMFHLHVSDSKVSLVEWGNFVSAKEGYYLENPYTREKILEWQGKLQEFVKVFDQRLKSLGTVTDLNESRNLIVEVAKEISDK